MLSPDAEVKPGLACFHNDGLHPELRALGVLEPHAEHVAVAVHRDRQREVAGLALRRAAITDLLHQRVEEHDRVDVVQQTCLPGERLP